MFLVGLVAFGIIAAATLWPALAVIGAVLAALGLAAVLFAAIEGDQERKVRDYMISIGYKALTASNRVTEPAKSYQRSVVRKDKGMYVLPRDESHREARRFYQYE